MDNVAVAPYNLTTTMCSNCYVGDKITATAYGNPRPQFRWHVAPPSGPVYLHETLQLLDYMVSDSRDIVLTAYNVIKDEERKVNKTLRIVVAAKRA